MKVLVSGTSVRVRMAICLLIQMHVSNTEVLQSKQFVKQSSYDGLLCEMEVSFAFSSGLSVRSCAASCAKTSQCSAIFFNQYSRECFGTVISLPSVGGCRPSNGTLLWALSGGYNYPCSSDDECMKTNMECRPGKCACQLGYSYQPSSDTCVNECSSYGSTYQEHPGFYLSGNNIDCTTGKTRPYCEAVCSADSTCRSWEFRSSDNMCCYSAQSAMSLPAAMGRSAVETYYHRDCA